MTLKLFETAVEAAEPQQTHVSFAARLLHCVWVSLVAVIPAIAATYSSLQITNLFRSMKNAESASAEIVLPQLHVLNMPLVIALGVSAFLAFAIALVIAIDPKSRLASVGLPFSIGILLIAVTPAWFLWLAETTVLDVFSGKVTDTPIPVVARNVSLLLFCALTSGLVAQAVTLICAIISLAMPITSRTDAFSLRRPFVWAVEGMLLLVFAGAFFILV